MADEEAGAATRIHGALRVLHLVLDAHRAVRAQDGLDEEILEAARGRLRDNEEPDPQHGAGEAHQHGTLLRSEKPAGDAKVGRHGDHGAGGGRQAPAI